MVIATFLLACQPEEIPKVAPWETYELSFHSTKAYANHYVDVDLHADFTNQSGERLRRPAFYDGDGSWKIRFAAPKAQEVWNWITHCSDSSNKDLHGLSGKIGIEEGAAFTPLVKMSPGKRSLVRQDDSPLLAVADTPWALPFRATKEQVTEYAADRQAKGFNAALLMSVQPDMEAEGPNSRNTELGFARGFSDLSDGHINNLEHSYFQYLDTLTNILHAHEIIPVFQPIFHGFGWKGKNVLGNHIVPAEYVRYTKYLLARYGSKPAIWLIAGDNGGDDPGVKEAGEMLEEWDCYAQPTGLHYNPCDDYVADWAVNNPLKFCMHYNKVHQAETWLDFQWAQTGHSDEHLYHKVERMYDNLPTKASMNGEPTYEGMNAGKNGLGWWQGEEAWMQLMSGGTMGIAYGAACLWQWKVSPDEPGWADWTNQDKSWREAMQMEGSIYAGMVGKILKEYDLTDIERRWDLADGAPLLALEGKLYITYLNDGGAIKIHSKLSGLTFKWVDPKSGSIISEGEVGEQNTFVSDEELPRVLIIS